MFIKRPGNGRTSYALIVDGVTLADPRISAVNADLRAGTPRDELEARMLLIRDSLRSPRLPLAHTNLRLVTQLHAYKIKRKPYLARPDWGLYALNRAAQLLGPLSIHTASEDQLLTVVSRLPPGARWHVSRAYNEMLRFLGRSERLPNPRPPRPAEIAFISVPKFLKVIQLLPADYQAVLGALYATGARWGELPLASFTASSVYISSQVRANGSRGLTKNRRARRAPLIRPLESLTLAYRAFPDCSRLLLRTHYPAIRRAFKQASGLKLHDLRHSYAVELRSVGVETSAIAEYIGDTVEVCRRHYLNYCATDREIDRVSSLWDK